MSDIAVEVTMNETNCEAILDKEQYDMDVELSERNVELVLEG